MRSSIHCRWRRRLGWTLCGRGARRLVALGVLAGTLATAEPAGAEAKFAFSWRAEPSKACLTEAKVRASVEKKLGRSVFSALDDADIVIVGEELRDPHRYRARVTHRDRAGRELGARELTAETCSALERMTVVFIALVLEPGGAPDRPEDERAPAEPEPDAPPERAAPNAPAAPDGESTAADAGASERRRRPVAARPEPPPRVALHAGVGIGVSSSMLPSVSGSVRLTTRLTVEGSRLSADWSAGLSLPQTVTEGAIRATFTTLDQQVRGCWAWLDRVATRIDTCAGAFFGALVPDGANLDDRNGAALSIVGPTAALGLRLSDGPGTVHVELGAVAPAFRHSINYLARGGEERTLYTTPPVMATAALAGTFRAF